jgi:hypothetical protein
MIAGDETQALLHHLDEWLASPRLPLRHRDALIRLRAILEEICVWPPGATPLTAEALPGQAVSVDAGPEALSRWP